MGANDILRYKQLLLVKQKDLSARQTRSARLSAVGESRGDPVDVATNEITATTQIWLQQSDGKLWRAIEDALTRIRREKFGVCEACGQPISKVRLDAVPWARHCKDCKERQGPRG